LILGRSSAHLRNRWNDAPEFARIEEAWLTKKE
jgi:hypothetical protein